MAHMVDHGQGAHAYRTSITTFRSEQLTIVPSESTQSPVRLELAQRHGIRGRLLNGSELSSPQVRLLQATAEPNWSRARRAQWSSQGEFAFGELDPGDYLVAITDGGSKPLVVKPARVTTGFTDCELTVPAMDPARVIRVSCLAPNGDPVPGCNLSMVFERGGEVRARERLRPVTGPDGSAVIRLTDETRFSPESLSSANVIHLVAQRSDFPVGKASWRSGQAEVEIRFPEPGSLKVFVTGLPDGLREKLTVDIRPLSDGLSTHSISKGPRGRRGPANGRSPALAPDGSVLFENLAPGPVELVLREMLPRYRTRELVKTSTEIAPGEQTISIAVPVLHELVVHVPGMPLGTRIELAQLDEAGKEIGNRMTHSDVETEPDRRARFSRLRAGNYRIKLRGSSEELVISVPSAEVRFEATTPNAIRVVVDNPVGLLARRGLQHDDVIIAIDGIELTRENLQETTRRLRDSSPVFTVLRAGQRVDVEFGPFPDRAGPGEAGGKFDLISR